MHRVVILVFHRQTLAVGIGGHGRIAHIPVRVVSEIIACRIGIVVQAENGHLAVVRVIVSGPHLQEGVVNVIDFNPYG